MSRLTNSVIGLGLLPELSSPLSLSFWRAASFILLLLSTVSVWAQGGGINGQVVQPAPPVGTGGPAANAAILVCPSTASGTPCSPTANLYSDPGLTQSISNPASADANGNYSFFVSPGYYIVQITPILGQSTVYSYVIFAGTGTVISVSLTMPNIFSLNGGAGCTITSSGTCAITFVSQSGNTVLAGPNGFAGLPSFRSLYPADLVAQNGNTVVGNCTGSSAVPSACPLTAAMIPSILNATSFSGNVGVTGNLSATGTLSVTGAATFSSTGSFTGAVSASAFNSTSGYEIGGSFGLAGQLLISTGSATTFTNANVLGQTAVASITPGTASNGSAVCASGATCLDNGGVVEVTTGSSVSGLGVVNIAFGGTHTSNACTISPYGGAAPPANMLPIGDNGTSLEIELFTTSSPLSTLTTYYWSYVCTFH